MQKQQINSQRDPRSSSFIREGDRKIKGKNDNAILGELI